MTDLSIALRLLMDSRQLTNGLRGGSRSIDDFSRRGRQQIGALTEATKGLVGTLAGVGVGLGAIAALKQSGGLDKYLARIGQTADASSDQVEGLRRSVFALARETGRSVEDIAGGFDTLIQKGLDFKSSLASISAITRASAVTGANEGVLAEALFVGGSTFGFDLSKQGQAVELLDQMYIAASSGSAELEQLATIFGVSGDKAKQAGLSFKQTLSLVEELSLTTPKERLGTLFDSTLRLFTNGQYIKAAQAATGVPFFDAKGARRDPSAVLGDFAKQYQGQKTAQARQAFLSKAFGGADQDTQTGLSKLISEGALDKFAAILDRTNAAGGAIASRLPGAQDNVIDQSARLAANLREAGENFARPINRALSDLIEFQLDPVEKGGLGLGPLGSVAVSGGLLIAAGAAGKAAGSLLKNIPIFGGAAADAANTAAGLAQGQLVKAAGLATPVFVTNFPAGGDSAGGGVIETAAAAAGAAAVARSGIVASLLARFGLTSAAGVGSFALGSAGVLAAGAGGYEVGGYISRNFVEGTQLSDQIGRAIATALAPFSAEARAALDLRNREPALSGVLKIEIDSLGRPRVLQLPGRGVEVDLRNGPLLPGISP